VPVSYFPHPSLANQEGLLALGGDLSPETLYLAYHFGIFPWYSDGQPILWWSPDPRCILWPDQLKISKSMRRLLRKCPYRITADYAFDQVISGCRLQKRKNQLGTWINDEMEEAYLCFHRLGAAHSIEVWHEEVLIAGIYGISLGKIFFGESMFTRVPNGSKYGFIILVQKLQSLGYRLIDCQQDTAHLRSLGATLISRSAFLAELKQNMLLPDDLGSWMAWNFDCADQYR
jgi:leucyl/phenylalanyl-tRNA---protein transferase